MHDQLFSNVYSVHCSWVIFSGNACVLIPVPHLLLCIKHANKQHAKSLITLLELYTLPSIVCVYLIFRHACCYKNYCCYATETILPSVWVTFVVDWVTLRHTGQWDSRIIVFTSREFTSRFNSLQQLLTLQSYMLTCIYVHTCII